MTESTSAPRDPQGLYGLPLGEFTARRNELAKALRRDGQKEEAAEVAKLRKPSAAAWAVNQLVRRNRKQMKALFRVGDALRGAQGDLLAGRGDPDALRSALDAERAAVDELVARARELLGGEVPPARFEPVAETLHAAALDEDARAQVEHGCLERELRHVGLGAGGAVSPAGSRQTGGSRGGKAERERAREQRARRKAEAAARQAAERARGRLETAQARRDRAAEALEAAESGLADASKDVEVTERALGESRPA